MPRSTSDTSAKAPDFKLNSGAGWTIIISSIVVFVKVADLFDSSVPFDLSNFLMHMAIGLGGMYIGLRWRHRIISRKAQEETDASEQLLMKAASRHFGRLTQSQLMVATGMSASEANAALENAVRQSLAIPDVLSSGTVQYMFPGLTGGTSESILNRLDEV